MRDNAVSLQQKLAEGARQWGIGLDDAAKHHFWSYLLLLQKWNRAYNLTAIGDQEGIVIRHFLDSLSLFPYLPKEGPYLDIGAGAGFPGVPLALVCPRETFVLLESNGKKAAFLRQVVHELQLGNVRILEMRAEASSEHGHYTAVMSRAFSALSHFVELGFPFLRARGVLLAMKGPGVQAELSALAQPYVLEAVQVPFLNEARFIVRMEKPL